MTTGLGEEIERWIAPAIEPLGPFPTGWAERLEDYLADLVDANRRVNLVSRRSADQVVPQQLLPSLAALLVVSRSQPRRVLDVGSGGGFPGIPLAILRPRAQVDLVESIRKKCDFLREVQGRLRLTNLSVHHCRIERPTLELIRKAPFDLAVARAVGASPAVYQASQPLLRPDGALWTYAPPGEGLDWPQSDPRTSLVRHPRPIG